MEMSFLLAGVCATAMLLCCVATVKAQEDSGEKAEHAAPIPQLQFHLVPEFFHFPPNSMVGRVSGIAVSPTGNIGVRLGGLR